jgi:CBS domain-containing protein
MATVGQLLEERERNIWSISPESTAYEALQIMADKNIGALLVIYDGNLVGIFSERDYARKVILKGKSSKETSVSKLMTRDVVYISPGESLENCMALMTAKHIRHLPVIESKKLLGLVTLGDIVTKIISDRDFKIHELEKYIRGGFEE